MIFSQHFLWYKEFPPLFLSCFQNLAKIVTFLFFYFRSNSMESGLPKGSPLLFHLQTTWNQLSGMGSLKFIWAMVHELQLICKWAKMFKRTAYQTHSAQSSQRVNMCIITCEIFFSRFSSIITQTLLNNLSSSIKAFYVSFPM